MSPTERWLQSARQKQAMSIVILLSVLSIQVNYCTGDNVGQYDTAFGNKGNRCRPVFTCPVQQAANFTEIATVVVKVSDLADRLRAVEKMNAYLKRGLDNLSGKGSENTWEVRRCNLGTESSSPDSLVLDGTVLTPSSAQCQALGSTVVPGSTYEISADVYNKQGYSGINSGHPGILFNAINSKNFDMVYFRLNSPTGCYQTGYLADGKWVGIRQGTCPHGPPRGGVWFNFKVKVTKFSVSVHLNDAMVVSYVPHYPARGQGGAFVWLGYNNIAMFKNFKITS